MIRLLNDVKGSRKSAVTPYSFCPHRGSEAPQSRKRSVFCGARRVRAISTFAPRNPSEPDALRKKRCACGSALWSPSPTKTEGLKSAIVRNSASPA